MLVQRGKPNRREVPYITMIPKLFQWLLVGGALMSVWLAVVMELVQIDIANSYKEIILVLPLYLLIAFACFSLAVIGYRVSIFNDCVDASEELKQQITEAKQDLEKKGFKFKEKKDDI